MHSRRLTLTGILLTVLTAWAIYQYLDSRNLISANPPEYGTVDTIEQKYAREISELTTFTEKITASDIGWKEFSEILSAPEILSAELAGSEDRGNLVFKDDQYRSFSRTAILRRRISSIGRAVTNQYWDTLPDKSKRAVVEYSKIVLDRDGSKWTVLILFDAEKLKMKFDGEQ